MIEIKLIQLDPGIPFQSALLPYLSLERREKILKYKNTDDKKQSMLAELLIRKAASNACNIPYDKVSIRYNPYGKPYIANVRHFKFNISHSEEYVVLATSKYKIGIDIEKIKKADLAIAKRFFTPSECAYIHEYKTPEEKKNAFYQLWTLKESYIKAVGKGLHIPLNTFEFEIGNKIALKSYNKYNFYFINMKLNEYMLSVCCQEIQTDPKIQFTGESDFYSYFKYPT